MTRVIVFALTLAAYFLVREIVFHGNFKWLWIIGFLAAGFAVNLCIGWIITVVQERRGPRVEVLPDWKKHHPPYAITVMRIAIDASMRERVEEAWAPIAKLSHRVHAEVQRLRDVSVLLRGVRDAWLRVEATNERAPTRETAKALFDAHVENARAAAPDAILVSVVICSEYALLSSNQDSSNELQLALDELMWKTPNLIALEVVLR